MGTGVSENFTPLMKVRIRPIIEQVFESEAFLLNRLGEAKGEPINLRGYEIPIETGRNNSYGWITDDGAMPKAGARQQITAKVGLTTFVHALRISGTARQIFSQGDDVAVTNLITHQTKMALVDATKVFGRMITGDGTGALGKVASKASADLTMDTPYFQYWLDPSTSATAGLYESRDAAGTVHDSAIQLITVGEETDHKASAVSAANVSTTVAGDSLFISGGYQKAIRGVDYHMQVGGEWQTLNKTTTPKLNPRSVTGSGTLQVTDLRTMYTRLIIRYGKESNIGNVGIYSDVVPQDSYEQTGYPQLRFPQDGNPKKLNYSYSKFGYGPFEWNIDTNFRADRVYFLDLGSFAKFETKKIDFVNFGGSQFTLEPASGGGHNYAWLAYLDWVGNIGCYDASKNGVISNLTIPAGLR